MPTPPLHHLPDLHDAIRYAAEKWNAGPGAVFGVTVGIDAAALNQQRGWEAALFDGSNLPRVPGPFKRAAAFSVLSQYSPPFRYRYEPSRPDLVADDAAWLPRTTWWSLPFLASVLCLGGQPLGVGFLLPTPHYQLEVVAYLRNLRASVNGRTEIDLAAVTERVVLLSLAIEGASYASAAGGPALEKVAAHAQSCVSPQRADDLRFNSEDFLTLAAGIGVN